MTFPLSRDRRGSLFPPLSNSQEQKPAPDASGQAAPQATEKQGAGRQAEGGYESVCAAGLLRRCRQE